MNKIKTWHFENAFVASALIAVWVATGCRPVEFIGAGAVFCGFCHASIAERMREREGALYIVPGNMTEECIPYGSPRPEDVAIVRVAHAGAIGLGYCLAPVVVAFDASTPGKVTIACYNTRYLDVEGLLADLRERETGWGGNVRSGILGSPQNGGTKLRDDTIVNLVAKRLK